MSVFPIKKDDILPALRMVLRDENKVPLDLTNATVVFRMRPSAGGAFKVNSGGSVIGTPTDGVVEYAWQGTDTDTVGTYLGEWKLTYPAGLRTVPTTGFVTIQVGADLDD